MRGWPGIVLLAVAMALVPAPAGAQEDDAEGPGGSIVVQVMRAAEESLDAEAPVAVARAFDRGYDGIQIVEGLFDGSMTSDGVITEDDETVTPFRPPSGVVAGDDGPIARVGFTAPRGSGEEIGIAALEAGIEKTTKRLDKQYDLDARAERVDLSEPSMITMALMIAAMFEGYSPEQLILDGLIGRGLRLKDPGRVIILDARGKRITPGVDEVSEEQEEAGDVIESFVLDAVEIASGIDPHTAADTPFEPKFEIDVEITAGSDYSLTITGEGRIGLPDDRKQREFLVGSGDGELVAAGACFLSGIGGTHPYEVSGNIAFGVSGRAEAGTAKLRVAITDATLDVVGDDSLCVDIVRETAVVIESISFPPTDVRLRDGATGTSQISIGGDPFDLTITLRV